MRYLSKILDFVGGGLQFKRVNFMIKKILFLLSIMFISIGLCSCSYNVSNESSDDITNGSNNNTSEGNDSDDNVDVKEWNSVSDLYFGYGIKKNDIDNFFIKNGTKVNDLIHVDDEYYSYQKVNTTIIYGINNGSFNISNAFTSSQLKDVEVTNAFGVTKVIKATVYTEYVTSISVNYYDSLDKAVFGASYNGAIIDSNIEILDAQSGTYNYFISKIGDGYILPSYSDVNVRKVESTFNIDSNVPSICYSFLKTSMSLFNDFVKEIGSNYSVTALYNENDWNDINWDMVQFTNKEVVYDGKTHSLYAANVPDGVKVSYSEKELSSPGEHVIEATFYDPKGRKIGSKSAVLFINDEFDISFKFYYGDNLLSEKTLTAHYGEDLISIADEYVPDGYIIANDNLEWAVIGDQNIEVDLMGDHEGYLKILSDTNAELNGKYLSYELIDYSYAVNKNQIISTTPYGENQPIEFFLDEINGIEFCNSLYIYSKFLFKSSQLVNLTSVDISNMKYLTEIPDGFFYGCKNLTTVTGHELDYLSKIGDNFLRNTNLINFDVDLSNVTYIGRCFMRDALIGEESREITIDLPLLQSIYGATSGEIEDYQGEIDYVYFLYQSKKNSNAVVNIKTYDFLLTNNMFEALNFVFDYEIQKPQKYSFVNLNIYTNKVSSQERLINELPGKVSIIALE